METCHQGLMLRISSRTLGLTPTAVWNPSPSLHHRTSPHELPMSLKLGVRDNMHSASRFSPPPFAIVVQGKHEQILIQVIADDFWHRWNEVTFHVTTRHVEIFIDLQGQTDPDEAIEHVRVQLILDDNLQQGMTLLAKGLALVYPVNASQTTHAQPVDWWLKPSHCGWGDQAALALQLEGPGMQCAAMAYCIQGLYERWIKRLEDATLPVGTIIIDAGWSPAGCLKPDHVRWPDLKRQHDAGRRVALWLATWLWEGLPDEWCLHVHGHKLCSDPTHPGYRAYLRETIHELLSPNGLDADGFKIDQLSFCPDTRTPIGGPRFGWCDEFPPASEPIRLAQGDLWGVELLYQLQRDIYLAAKQAKPDCLITSSTVHPYFRGTFDMIRLHDMGEVATDIFAAMQARADLAMAALPGMPMDADDWIHTDYDLWRTYTAGSGRLGVPCTFYAENFILNWNSGQQTCPIDPQHLQEIAIAWRACLDKLKHASTVA